MSDTPHVTGIDATSTGVVPSLADRAETFLARHVRPVLVSLAESASTRNATLVAAAWLASIWIFVVTLVVLFVGSASREARNTARNTAVMAAAYVGQTMTSGDIVLRSMHSLLAENGVADEPAYRGFVTARNVHETLRDRVGNLQEIDKAAFISARGEVLNFSFRYPVPPINVSDRDYFVKQTAAGAPPLTIGMVALDRGSGSWTFYLSQRVADAGGGVIGLAIVGLKADFLANFFARTTMSDDVAIVLQRDDGVVLTGSGISPESYGKSFDLRGPDGAAVPGDGPQVVELEGAPSVPTLRGGSDYVEAIAPIKGVPARIVVLVNRMAFMSQALAWSLALAVAALVGSAIVIYSWRRSLRVIREGLRMSRISSMQAMTSAIAHELNQPLSATSNYLAVATRRLGAAQPPDAGQQRETLEKARTQLLRAGDIIRRLRSFISEGKTDLREADLGQVIESAIDFSLVRDRHGDVVLDVRLEPGLPAVHIDPIQVQQVLLNLIRNGAEAMAGQKDKRIEIACRAVGSRLVEVCVADSGPGLPPAIARHVFEPFNTSKTDGMGVGLAICRTIVESHGGSIRYQARGRGAAFFFTLRRAEPSVARAA